MTYLQNKLQQIMKTRGLKQKQLAEMGGVSDNAISKWVNGLSCPKIETLEPLAKALGLTIGDLTGDFGNNQELSEEDKRFIALTPQRKALLLKFLDAIESEKD